MGGAHGCLGTREDRVWEWWGEAWDAELGGMILERSGGLKRAGTTLQAEGDRRMRGVCRGWMTSSAGFTLVQDTR